MGKNEAWKLIKNTEARLLHYSIKLLETSINTTGVENYNIDSLERHLN